MHVQSYTLYQMPDFFKKHTHPFPPFATRSAVFTSVLLSDGVPEFFCKNTPVVVRLRKIGIVQVIISTFSGQINPICGCSRQIKRITIPLDVYR